MTVGKNLQEMQNQVTKDAKPAEPMPKAANYVPDNDSIEVLGGPTPQNSKPDDESNKLKSPSATFIAKSNPITKGSAGTVQMPGPQGAVGMKASGYGRGANEEVEVEDESFLEDEEGSNYEEDEFEEEEELDLEDDVKALLSGEDLSEEFQEKAKTVFEAAVRSKISSLRESMEHNYESALIEQVEQIKFDLTERVDSYLEYVANEWINENELQIESGLKGELSESFMTGLKNLFEEHYVEIPEEKYNVVEAMVQKLDEMEIKLNEQITTNISLNKRLSESVSNNIIDEVSEGLALSQKEKLAALAESVEFESEGQYREKLKTLREAYFAPKLASNNSQEVISEEVNEDYGPTMNAYLHALTKFN
jgi:SHS2 domain-containing protein